MLPSFKSQLHSLVGADDCSFLLAVSGGIDSMAMASLFVAAHYKKVTIAHVNFGLRGEDSDADETLVRDWAEKYHLPCYVQRFDTRNYAATHKISVEMAARMLRYQWFEELRKLLQIDFIAVAHHANDHAETILLNLTRGTGVRGLCGISPKRGALIRPMLAFDRKQIEEYAEKMNFPFREDATNASPDFSRNRIRHNVLPELAKINPNVVERLNENGTYFRQAGEILGEMVEEKRSVWCRKEGDVTFLEVEKIAADAHAPFWLFELLHPYGFHERQMKQIVEMLHAQPGGRVNSKSHTLFRDRKYLALRPCTTSPKSAISDFLKSDCSDDQIDSEAAFTVSIYDSSDYQIKDDTMVAALDADKLHFPLTLRLWQSGDRFIPLGMKGFKKVSDFLIDTKVPLWEKEHQRVICSARDIAHNSACDIVWVVGLRIDERYKVTETTKRVAEVTLNYYARSFGNWSNSY